MKLKELKPADYNPRKISDEQLSMLKKALEEFGDLSGIVFNRRTGNLVGGHQRLKCLPEDAKIEKKELKKPTHTGTVAEGFIILPSDMSDKSSMSERLSYREVDWPLEKEKAANIAANKHGGEFDDELLKNLLEDIKESDIDVVLTGFNTAELNKLFPAEEKCELPITSKLFESYNYILIFTNNITDFTYLENLFDLKPMKSYKSKRTGITRVIPFETFISKIQPCE